MELMEAIRGRRSVNFFEAGVEIPDKKIRELLELANLSLSSFNLQPWNVVVVRSQERKKVLRKCAFDQSKAEEASAVLIMVADPECLEKNLERVLDSWEELGYIQAEAKETYRGMTRSLYGPVDGEKRKFTAIKNTALYAMTLMLSARDLSLETHAMDGFDEACIKKEFNIPEDKIIPMLIAAGYLRKGVKLLPRAFRRDLDEFVRFDVYEEKGG